MITTRQLSHRLRAIGPRLILLAGLALGIGLGLGSLAQPAMAAEEARIEPKMTDDGLYTQEWFLESFLELKDDLAEAHADGKRFAIIWEQKGCPYCKQIHTDVLSDPKVNKFVRENFVVLQLNLWGDREVTDFDGEALSEKEIARKYNINFTPTIQFFPETPEETEGRSGQAVEVQRMPGAFRKFHFQNMFKFVLEKAYEDTHFQRYIVEAARAAEEN